MPVPSQLMRLLENATVQFWRIRDAKVQVGFQVPSNSADLSFIKFAGCVWFQSRTVGVP